MNNEPSLGRILAGIAIVLSVACGGIGACCYIAPQYDVYKQEKAGEAELKRAESSRRIAVLEAQAIFDSSKLKADASIEQAKGVAEANRIIGDGLKGHEEYLRYLMIQGLHDSETKIIYVPTEAGLPILEAKRDVP